MSLPPPLNYSTPPQFSEENLKQLAVARAASKKIRRAVGVANFDGWTMAAFGALTMALGIGFGDLTSAAIGLVLGAIGFVEVRSAAQLKRLKVEATRTLALNQMALAALLIVYAAWRLYVTSQPGALSAEMGVNDPDVASMLGSVDDLTRVITRVLYGGLIAYAICAPGGLAWYYFTRAKHLKAYLAQTPAWILTLQEQGVAI